MEPYNKISLRKAGIISTIGALLALIGYYFTQEYLFVSIGFVIIGAQSIYFSHDLAMERVVKYKLNYKFCRSGYILVGIIFITVSIIGLIK